MENYRKIQLVGKGSFAHAVLVQSVKDKKQYIMKIIEVSRMDRKQKEDALNEVHVLKAMRHPYIVTYRESFIDKRCLCIVMDYADGGDLYTRIARQKKLGRGFSESQILDWFVQMCLALKHIHERRILHRDLKTQNIFLTKSGDVKIGDFGISRILPETTDLAKTAIGTPYYLSPEICQEKPYNQRSDVWSLGCILYELITLRHAFDANTMKKLVVKILRGTYADIPSIYSDNLRELIREMLRREPEERPTMEEILEKSFLSERITDVITRTVANYEIGREEVKSARDDRDEREEFLTPEGDLVPGTQESESIYSQIEAVRIYLEGVLGDTFFSLYEYMKKSGEEQKEEEIKGIVGPENMKYLPLVYQAIVCEESYFGVNS